MSIDFYGRKSLENRFVFYLSALVLMMMTFCGSIVTSEMYRAFADEAAKIAAQVADRVAKLGPAAKGAVLFDPQVIAVGEWIPGRGPVHLMGEVLSGYRLPSIEPTEAFDTEPLAGGRSAWGFVERRGNRALLVLIDSQQPMAQLRLLVGTLFWITGLALVVHSFLAMVMARAVLRPIRQSIDAMRKVTTGQMAHALTVAEQDEVGQLKAAFNYMQEQLQKKEAAERQVAANQHMATVGQLAAGVAHEIRNPLASISSLTQMIAGDPGGPPKTQEYARVILREIQRMDASIQQLLNFAKPLKSEFAPARISAVIEHVAQLMEVEAKNRGATLRVEAGWPDEAPLLVDAGKLEQALINLVKNAMEAIGAKGTITLSLSYDHEKEQAVLAVEDDGPGMSQSLKAGAFDTWVTTKGGGSGLGLAIVQRLVVLHHGQITVDTEVNRGTRFTIRIPRLTPEMISNV